MHGHDGCGCGHAHNEIETVMVTPGHDETEAMTQDMVMDTEMESCGEGCGCAHGAGDQLQAVEIAAMQGFLSGLYASQMNREEMAAYFEAMAGQGGSEFARPAQYFGEALAMFEDDGSGQPLAAQFLAFVADEESEGEEE